MPLPGSEITVTGSLLSWIPCQVPFEWASRFPLLVSFAVREMGTEIPHFLFKNFLTNQTHFYNLKK